jgi:hypothetical protein
MKIARGIVALVLAGALGTVLLGHAYANVLWGYWQVGPQVSQPIETATATATATPVCLLSTSGKCPNCADNCASACNAHCGGNVSLEECVDADTCDCSCIGL